MKRLLILSVLIFVLAGCSAAPATSAQDTPAAVATTTPVPAAGEQPAADPARIRLAEDIILTDFEDAANLRNQLAYGTLKLDGAGQAITPEQARAMLPLWQAVVALSGEGESVPEEISAVQTQIIEARTAEQVQAIAEMKITNAALTAFYAEKGIVMPTPVPGVTKVPGQMKNLSPEARQATRAAMEASGQTGQGTGQLTRTLLFEEVIKLLTERAG